MSRNFALKCTFLKNKGNSNRKEVSQSKIIYVSMLVWEKKKQKKQKKQNLKKKILPPKKASNTLIGNSFL